MNGLRPRLGRSTSCWRSSTCPCEAFEVSTSGTSSVTWTLSLTEPISILRSSETVSCVATITCLRSNLLKPGASATTVYVAEAPGFKRFERKHVIVATQETVSLDLKMEIGSVSESVQVTEEVPLIETSNASQGQVLDRQQLVD